MAFGPGLAFAMLATVLMSAPVVAAAVLSVEPPSGVPGAMLVAKGAGYPANQAIRLRWDGGFLPETGSSDGFGGFAIPFAIPTSAAPGGHQLRACVRSACSLAPPFTVAVVAAPGPTLTPKPTVAPTPPPPTPAPSLAPTAEPSPAPTAELTPAPTPTAGVTPTAGDTPAAPSAGFVTDPPGTPTVLPTALPADPSAPGTVKVQFYWDSAVFAGLLTLAVVAVVAIGAKNEKWFRGSSGKIFVRRSFQIFTAGKDAPAKGPKLYEAMSTHAPPMPPTDLVQHEATHAADTGSGAGNDTDADAVIAPDAGTEADASKDVKLKGKNIGEN
jgi:hypothetical protein